MKFLKECFPVALFLLPVIATLCLWDNELEMRQQANNPPQLFGKLPDANPGQPLPTFGVRPAESESASESPPWWWQ